MNYHIQEKVYKEIFVNKNMNFVKKIFQGEYDEDTHFQFQKFSKGEFRNRALINAKKSGSKYTISTSAEFANELVRYVAGKLGDGKTNVTGAIVSTNDLKEDLDFKEIKQFQGVKRYLIDKEMSGSEILSLITKFPKAFFALSFDVDSTKLKIKPKAPKSGKPGSKGSEKPKANFCKLITEDKELGGSFVFEAPEFKKADIGHVFMITEIVFPQGETDYAKIREMAKRKGKIIRIADIDGQETKSEKEFEA